ncbi:MAG: V-type ATPase subunit [Acidilobus sp.]
MPGSADYARLVPVLRYMKSRMLGPKLKEIAPPLSEAVMALRESLYSRAAEAKDPESLERALAAVYFSNLEEVYRLAPAEARGLINAFGRLRELEDIMTVARALAEGQPPPRWLPSMEWGLSSTAHVLQELEASASLSRLQEAVRDRDLKGAVAMALEAYTDLRQPEVFTFLSLLGGSLVLRGALAAVGGPEAKDVERIMCPLVEERAALGLLEAWALRLNPKTFARAVEGPKVCGVDWALLAAAYERGLEGEVTGLVMDVSPALRYVKLEGRSVKELMDSARRSARLAAHRASLAAFEGYPFTPALVAAALTLLTLEVDSVRALVGGIMLNLTQEELEQAVI